jgi:ABC-type phosphate transport system substrate-binding protein
VIKNKIGALAGVARCSRSASPRAQLQLVSSSNKRPAAPPALPQRIGTISGAGSTFAAPVYEQWGLLAVGR